MSENIINYKFNNKNLCSSFLTYLSFNSQPLRIGVEIASCFSIYIVFQLFIPWGNFGISKDWYSLFSWLASCLTVVLLDQFILSRSIYTFRKAYQLSLVGAYQKALLLLDQVSPYNSKFFCCPEVYYHLLRAEILMLSESFLAAEREIKFAENYKAPKEQLIALRAKFNRLLSPENSPAGALNFLQNAKEAHGETAIICLEEGLLLLEEHQDLWKAKKQFKKVVDEMQEETHFCGEKAAELAEAGLAATKLWTGEAEEGLNNLNKAIDKLRSHALYLDTLRPVLALLYLERSHYLATHKEPAASCFDLRMALALCSHPNIRKKAVKVQEELSSRYQVLIPI